MRKLITLLLAVMLLALPVMSLAQETTAETKTFTQADGLYTFDYPSTWTTMDRASIDATLELAKTLGDETLTNSLESYKDIMSQMDIAMIMSEDRLCNVVISFQEIGAPLSSEQLLSLAPSLVAQYEVSFSEFEATNPGSTLDVGENSFMLMEYNASSVGQSIQGAAFYIVPDTKLFTIVLTAPGGTIDDYLNDFMSVINTIKFVK